METTIMGYIGTTISIHSYVPSSPKASRAEGENDEIPLNPIVPLSR